MIRRVVGGRVVGGRVADVYVRALFAAAFALLAASAARADARLGVGVDSGAPPQVRVLQGATRNELQSFFAYDVSFTGGTRVALGDLDGDGVSDLVVGAGPGAMGARVRAFSGVTGAAIRDFFALPSFVDGIYVATGDVDGDGRVDIVVGAGSGTTDVRVFDGRTSALIRSFAAFTGGGGARVAAGDLDGDGLADLVVARGSGFPSQVRAFRGTDSSVLHDFIAYQGFSGGVFVAAGDLDGDGRADIVTSGDSGTALPVRGFRGTDLGSLANFLPYGPTYANGVRVAAGDVNGDGLDDIATSAGPGTGGPITSVFRGPSFALDGSFFAFSAGYNGGVYVAAPVLADLLLSDGFE